MVQFLICQMKSSELWTVVFLLTEKEVETPQNQRMSPHNAAEMFSCVSYFN